MKLTNYFKDFLDNEVNLNPARITLLDERTETITGFIKVSELFEVIFKDIIAQGSYAHKMIIKPVQDTDEFDADVLLYIDEVEEWEPKDYVQKLYEAFRGSSTYRNMVSRKTRCVTITYANDFHMDVVPFIERHGKKYVTNRHDNTFELTDPEKFTEWLDDKNRITKHHFVKVMRLLKYLRDYKQTFSVKSIILSSIVGNLVNDAALLEDANCYDDVPTTLYTIMKKLKSYVNDNILMPTISDPGETGENFGDRWEQDGWDVFRTKMLYYADKIIDAFEENDKEKSIIKWQNVFGTEFKKSETKLISEKRSLVAFDNTEQQISDMGIALAINQNYKVKLNGSVDIKPGHRGYLLSQQGNKVNMGRGLTFKLKNQNIPEPFTIYWKVLNRGNNAETLNQVRGQIIEGTEYRTERTAFKGNHYVECYIVKDGKCVAKDRQSVIIV